VAENKKEALNSLSYGWCGKILKVDLSSEVITEIDTHPYADRFLGGRGIATRLYWEYVPATARAFDPERRIDLFIYSFQMEKQGSKMQATFILRELSRSKSI
jgi:hypothetical protein